LVSGVWLFHLNLLFNSISGIDWRN
jgi:hypothetical protein